MASTVSLVALGICACAAGALGATAQGGAPPIERSIPIVFNDRTVSTKQDVLRQGRVLAALVMGNRLYLPVRGMLEAMGATVATSPDGSTVTAAKSGANVSVTVGKPEVIVNGETRPLDVPPIRYRGNVLVPVRVISEALGAYVLWLPERRIVVVRYNPPEPPPPSPPPAVATAPPTGAPAAPAPAATPAPGKSPYVGFIQGAFTSPRNYNEFADGQYCPESFLLNAAYAFNDSPVALKLDYRQDAYVTSDNLAYRGNHYTSFATVDGGQALTPVFLARQSSFDARLEFQIAAPRVYVGVAYLHASNNYGYPQLNGVGFGIEKLSDLRSGLNPYASAFYYPSASGTYRIVDAASSSDGRDYRQEYRFLKYDVGLAFALRRFPVYIYGGYSGDRYFTRQNAPIAQTHDGPYAGLGVKL